MTISTTTNRQDSNGNGSSTAFVFAVRVDASSDLTVYVDDVLRTLGGGGTYDYTASGYGDPAGVTVTFNTAPPSGTGNIVFLREVDYTQTADYVDGDEFPAAVHEGALDRIVMMVQQVVELIDRTPILSPTTAATLPFVIPEPEADQLLGWNAAGTELENKAITDASTTVITAFAATLLDDSNAAQMLTTLGLDTRLDGISSDGATASMRIPIGTTAQRPTPVQGQLRFNTTTANIEWYDGSAWTAATGLQGGGAVLEHAQNVSSDFTIEATNNGLAAGPLIIDSGKTITVASGATLAVV
jgi:hypothetical protein